MRTRRLFKFVACKNISIRGGGFVCPGLFLVEEKAKSPLKGFKSKRHFKRFEKDRSPIILQYFQEVVHFTYASHYVIPETDVLEDER